MTKRATTQPKAKPQKRVPPTPAPGRVHAPEGFKDRAGRQLLSQVRHEDYVRLSFCVEPRCRICKLAHTDLDLLVYINESSHTGVPQQEVVAECERLGFRTNAGNIGEHKRKHFDPQFREFLIGLQVQATRAKMMDEAVRSGQGLGSTIMRELWARIQPLLEQIDVDSPAFRRLTPRQKAALVLTLAKEISRAENADAGTQLRLLDQRLKQLRLAQGEAEQRRKIISRLRTEFKAYPEVWAVIEQVAAALERGDAAVAPALLPTPPEATP